MSGPYEERRVTIHRHDSSTSWGFRILGGWGSNQPLMIRRVFAGGQADGLLHRGDVIITLQDDDDAAHLNLSQAEAVINNARNVLSMRVKSPLSERHKDSLSPQTSPSAHTHQGGYPQSGGYLQPGMPYSANQLFRSKSSGAMHEPRTSAKLSPNRDLGTDYGRGYSTIPARGTRNTGEVTWPVRQYGDYSTSAGAAPAQSGHTWSRPDAGGIMIPQSILEPGWPPQRSSNDQHSHATRTYPLSAQPRAPAQLNAGASGARRADDALTERPAWAGSLRSSGGPLPWKVNSGAKYHASHLLQPPHQRGRQEADRHYASMGNLSSEFGQHGQESTENSNTIAMNQQQYNNPIGLYAISENPSRGWQRPGTTLPGNAKTEFNPANSSACRYRGEEETPLLAGRARIGLEGTGAPLPPTAPYGSAEPINGPHGEIFAGNKNCNQPERYQSNDNEAIRAEYKMGISDF